MQVTPSTLELYSEKIIVQYSLKKRVILISHIFRIGSTKSTFFSVLYFFPYTVSCAYNFSAVNHLLLTEVKVLFYVRSGAFVGCINSTFVSRTRVFSSFLYRLFNNRACNELIFKCLFFILPHFGNILLHFGKSNFYFTTLWQLFYHTLASNIKSSQFNI